MRILALECSAGPASAAVLENGVIVASAFTNLRMTHSQTLMPMTVKMLRDAGLSLSDIDALAISNGPGSFTGIRIGISAIKGIAAPKRLPCYGVSTLRAIAENHKDFCGVVCPVMDARCNQVYNALFKVGDGQITRLCDDRALMIDELLEELRKFSENIIISGDGAHLFEQYESKNVTVIKDDSRFQRAEGVALAALECEAVPADKLMPFYLRLPQAERELRKKQGEK